MWLHFYNFTLSLYIIVCSSFFYKQYLTVKEVNISKYSDFTYFIKDNLVLVILFSLVFFSILFNFIYISEYLVFTSREEIKIRRIIGYTYIEIIKAYYVRLISMLLVSVFLASLIAIPILYYFYLPIFFPIIISLVSIFLIFSILIICMVKYCLSKYKKGKVYEMTYVRKAIIILQFTISLMLIFISIILFVDVNSKISPYRNYVELDNAWMLKVNVETIEESIDIDMNPEEYHENIIPKIKKI